MINQAFCETYCVASTLSTKENKVLSYVKIIKDHFEKFAKNEILLQAFLVNCPKYFRAI